MDSISDPEDDLPVHAVRDQQNMDVNGQEFRYFPITSFPRAYHSFCRGIRPRVVMAGSFVFDRGPPLVPTDNTSESCDTDAGHCCDGHESDSNQAEQERVPADQWDVQPDELMLQALVQKMSFVTGRCGDKIDSDGEDEVILRPPIEVLERRRASVRTLRRRYATSSVIDHIENSMYEPDEEGSDDEGEGTESSGEEMRDAQDIEAGAEGGRDIVDGFAGHANDDTSGCEPHNNSVSSGRESKLPDVVEMESSPSLSSPDVVPIGCEDVPHSLEFTMFHNSSPEPKLCRTVSFAHDTKPDEQDEGFDGVVDVSYGPSTTVCGNEEHRQELVIRSQSGSERMVAFSNRSSGYGTGSGSKGSKETQCENDVFSEGEQNSILNDLVSKSNADSQTDPCKYDDSKKTQVSQPVKSSNTPRRRSCLRSTSSFEISQTLPICESNFKPLIPTSVLHVQAGLLTFQTKALEQNLVRKADIPNLPSSLQSKGTKEIIYSRSPIDIHGYPPECDVTSGQGSVTDLLQDGIFYDDLVFSGGDYPLSNNAKSVMTLGGLLLKPRSEPDSPASEPDDSFKSQEMIVRELKSAQKEQVLNYVRMMIEQGKPYEEIEKLLSMSDNSSCSSELALQFSNSSGSSVALGYVKRSTQGSSGVASPLPAHRGILEGQPSVFSPATPGKSKGIPPSTAGSIESTHSRFSFEKEDLDQLENLPRDHSVEFQSQSVDLHLDSDGEALLCKLRMANCCRNASCSNQVCLQGQDLLQYLETQLETADVLDSSSCHRMLCLIAAHATTCDEMTCPVPLCHFFHNEEMSEIEQIARLKRIYFAVGNIMAPWKKKHCYKKLSQLDHDLPYDINAHLTEGIHWENLSWLGKLGTMVYAMGHIPSFPTYWVIKKVTGKNCEANDHMSVKYRWMILETVSQRSHPNIVHHLWMIQQSFDLLICWQFADSTLACQLQNGPLPGHLVWRYLADLLEALTFLQQRGIIYLAWTACNVLVASEALSRNVQLGDFSLAVSMDSLDEEMKEDLFNSVHPTIVPPEFYLQDDEGNYCHEVTGHKADIWGLGCLTYHMIQGHPVHHDLRHEELSYIRDELQENPKQDLSRVREGDMRHFLRKCFEVDPVKRASVAELKALVQYNSGVLATISEI